VPFFDCHFLTSHVHIFSTTKSLALPLLISETLDVTLDDTLVCSWIFKKRLVFNTWEAAADKSLLVATIHLTGSAAVVDILTGDPQMKKTIKKSQAGFVMTTELVLILSVMVIGMVVGLVTMRDSLTAEMEDVAEAIGQLDQSYAFDGLVNAEGTAFLEGSGFVDATDANAGDLVTFDFIAADYSEAATNAGANTTAGSGAENATGASAFTP